MNNGEAIETTRLQLRKLTLDDADLLLDVWNDPAFIRYVGDRGIRTIAEAHDAMQQGALRLYDTYGYGPYRMALRIDDTPVGICGLFRRDGLDEPDIGYSTLPDHCGRGYAYEAACAVIELAHAEFSLERLIAIISPDNDASIGLIRKLGFEFERMHTMPDDKDELCVFGKSLIR
jgi:RimJ/RimL family protein N-acetyltransferase